MCGICGFFQTGSEGGLDTLKRMSGRIVHRGPDDEGYHLAGRVGLAARRLSIIDLPSGHQPLASRSGKCWIAYNGEVYNYAALRRELADRGYSFRTQSDTEAVVNLYEEFGPAFVTRLRGMFAFAIHDERNDRLLLARDRIGKKPLYYAIRPDGTLVFGSEIKCLLEYPGIDREIDPEALDLFLTLEYIPAPYSIFRSIRKLPAGHLLVLENGTVKIDPYWDVPAAAPGRRRSLAGLREEFLALLEESVRLRMISDVPLGAFLSGGIDSSSIVAMMAKNSPQPIRTFSIGFEEKSYSELPYAQAVAERFATDHYVRHLKPQIGDLVLQLAGLLDEPLGDFSNFPTYLVSRTARERVTVVLSGDGGDEIFGGYEHYLAQRLARMLDLSLLRPFYPLAALANRWLPPSELKKGWLNRVKRFAEGLRYPPADRHFRWMIFFANRQKQRLYAADFLRPEFLRPLHERPPFAGFFHGSRKFPGLNRDLYLDLKTYLADDIMVKVDRMSMATSLEARAPLLDHRLVEFAFSLPPRMKVRGRTTKWFFKKAMAGILPPEIIHRQKEGFSIPIKNWLKGDLKPLLQETLAEKRVNESGWFRYPYVKKLIDEHLAGRENHAHRLWALVSLFLWRDRFAR